MSDESTIEANADILARPEAGHSAIRGGMVSLAGYGLSTIVGTLVAILLLRYLGVTNYGRFATVIAIVGLAQGLADAGLSAVGQRGYAASTDPDWRRWLLADVVGLRLVLTPLAVLLSVALTSVAGYQPVIVAGVAIGGLGAVVALVTQTALIPASVALRFGAITGVSLARDLSGAACFIALVIAGVGLLPFLVVPTIAALVALCATVGVVGRSSLRARFSLQDWRPILVQAVPIGIAAAVNVLYLRALLIVTSLTTSGVHTGLYALSDRVVQIVVGGAATMFAASFPIVARAGGRDEGERLAMAQQQLFDVAIFAATLGALVFAIAAKPIVLVLGGAEYADSAQLLQIQIFALFGSFLSLVWLPALVAIHRQRALVFSSLAGLTAIVVAGAILIPAFGITGTAITAVVGEAAIAAAGLIALVRARPSLRPRLRAASKLVGEGVLCGSIAFVPGIPPAVAATLAAAAFTILAWTTHAVPRDPVDALLALRRRR